MLALILSLAVLVGVSLGVLGGGGSILTVPLLAYVAGLDARQAITTSLLVVGVTSVIGAVTHARAGHVQWRTGLLFGVTGTAGAYAGGLIGHLLPGSVLLTAFAVVMIATAVAMLNRRRACTAPAVRTPAVKTLLMGLVVGVVTGTLGAGGGFVVVPALALLGGLPMPIAVGTSLIVIAMNSFAGLAGQLSTAPIDWPLAAMVTAAAVAGSLLGARLTARVDPDTLRRAFGWFVLAMASIILAEEVHPVVGLVAGAATAIGAFYYFVCRRYAWCPVQRLFGPPAPAT
ncbi:membrane protein [Mycolicibacterium wolinskyi]|uniref:Probable membrane transporter protein n=1 Tax=Mycolicibacterium wolinskyi TaxID=59750 RepID=A0A132PIP7_9MYCO|nr:sulfite exporter TauE/SafE family protein [Mycolicibacterium wolinskyi]KWX22238.1 membrane protein [Mycolicibacterium wolinskyi]